MAGVLKLREKGVRGHYVLSNLQLRRFARKVLSRVWQRACRKKPRMFEVWKP